MKLAIARLQYGIFHPLDNKLVVQRIKKLVTSFPFYGFYLYCNKRQYMTSYI